MPNAIIAAQTNQIPAMAKTKSIAMASGSPLISSVFENTKPNGMTKAVQPKRYGGYELNPAVIYDLQIELGRGCASSAWVFGVLSVHTWQLALFPKETQDEVWGADPKALIGSSYMPVGKSEWVDGGVTLNGHWSFSSGCDHCQWTFLGGFVPTRVVRLPLSWDDPATRIAIDKYMQ